MKRLLVLFTGGTIASSMGLGGKAPKAERSAQLKSCLEEAFAHRSDVELVIREPWGIPGLDSSALSPVHWMEMTRLVAEEAKNGGLSGILALHGTDTMAFTAAWMSLCFGDLPIPTVLTGSQLTLDYIPDDAMVNLRGAAQACCFGPAGVWVYFNWKLFPGDSAHKRHSTRPDAFVALGAAPRDFEPLWGLPEGVKGADRRSVASVSARLRPLLAGGADRVAAVSDAVRVITLAPGCKPLLTGREQYLILLGYGAGNAAPEVLEQLSSSYKDHKPQVVACSQAEEGLKEPDGYADVGLAGLKKAGFTVWSQQARTFEFVYALCCHSLALGGDPVPLFRRYLGRC